MLGAERRSVIMTEEDKHLAAVHEAGHALIAKLTPGAPPINKAVIVPRGQAMGMVSFLAEERHSVTESKLKAHLDTALGGCVAESIVFGERSTGAQADYKQVTSLARSMICDWGMNKNLGPLSLGGEDEQVFLGKDYSRTRNYSEQTAQAIDVEIRELIVEAETRASRLLGENREKLESLSAALLDFEVLDDAEIDEILQGRQLAREPVGSTSTPEVDGERADPVSQPATAAGVESEPTSDSGSGPDAEPPTQTPAQG